VGSLFPNIRVSIYLPFDFDSAAVVIELEVIFVNWNQARLVTEDASKEDDKTKTGEGYELAVSAGKDKQGQGKKSD
jgi:hypothetical protein